jgi:citronellol/citronellal dehydrogenase
VTGNLTLVFIMASMTIVAALRSKNGNRESNKGGILMNDKKLKGQVAIVTGASRGIGKAIALALASAGAAVTVAARTIEESGPLKGTILETAEEIKTQGGRALPIQTNVADEASVENMIQKTLDEMGHIDILVNNAGTNIPHYFRDLTLKEWDLIIKVTLRSVIVCSKAVMPSMMAQRYGHIINMSSVAAITFNDPMTGLAYDVSKAGINRFTWGLAEELKEYNIAVNALMPQNTLSEGWVMLNPDVDKANWQTPELWGKIATFVVTRDPATFTGRILTIDDIEQEVAKVGWNL